MENFESLKQKIIEFNRARGWRSVPEDSAKSILIEGAELLEHYQWDTTDLGEDFVNDKNMEEIAAEVADILWYAITFCHEAEIDINEAIEKKLAHNEQKYPVEKFNGTHNEDFYRQQKKKYRQ